MRMLKQNNERNLKPFVAKKNFFVSTPVQSKRRISIWKTFNVEWVGKRRGREREKQYFANENK